MNSHDPGLQDSTIPLLTEVLDSSSAATAVPARTAAAAPPGVRPASASSAPRVPTQAAASAANPAAANPAAANPATTRPVPPPVAPAPQERTQADDEAGIPVLTVPLQMAVPMPVPVAAPARPAAPAAAVPARPASRPSDDDPDSAIGAIAARLSPDELESMQQKLTERILRQLQSRIDFVLEQRVRDSLADVLQLAMGSLTTDIKRGLQHTLEEVVGRAVAQEIARLQSGKK